jgi:leucyl aminopeptidase (aminopeptidase T)
MTDEAPKSAYELAMERLRQRDADEGVEERAVSDAQKAEIAEARSVHAAKTAEAEILYKSKLMTTFEPDERAKLEEQHRRDLARIQTDLDRKLKKIRD